MVFTLTAKNRTLPKQAEQYSSADMLRDFEAWLFANPSWLEDKGFGGIQAQIITASTTFPDLEFSNPGKARGFDYWYESVSKSADLLEDFEAWLFANPSWLEDKGFGGIQAQIITASTTFPDLEFSNPGKAGGFDYWYETIANAGTGSVVSSAPVVGDAVVSKPATDGLDSAPSVVPGRCMPIYWEEKVSEPVDFFDKDGIIGALSAIELPTCEIIEEKIIPSICICWDEGNPYVQVKPLIDLPTINIFDYSDISTDFGVGLVGVTLMSSADFVL